MPCPLHRRVPPRSIVQQLPVQTLTPWKVSHLLEVEVRMHGKVLVETHHEVDGHTEQCFSLLKVFLLCNFRKGSCLCTNPVTLASDYD